MSRKKSGGPAAVAATPPVPAVDSAVKEKAEQLALDVMKLARNRLTVDLRYMANPISMLRLTPAEGLENVMVDGRSLWYDPVTVLQSYRTAQEMPVHRYLHLVLHCVYQHFFVNTLVDRPLWDMACDIAVEATIEEAGVPSATMPDVAARQQKELTKIRGAVPHMTAEVIYKYLREQDLSEKRYRQLHELFSMDTHDAWYQQAGNPDNTSDSDESGKEGEDSSKERGESGQDRNREQDKQDGDGPGEDGRGEEELDSADSTQGDGDEQQRSGEAGQNAEGDGEQKQNGAGGQDEGRQNGAGSSSGGDGGAGGSGSSSRGGGPSGMSLGQLSKLRDEWKRAAEQMRMDIQAFGGRGQGDAPGSGLMENLNYAVREEYDYASFLQQFGVLGEAMKINDEEFDYSFYCYGIERYGNMPLIEPLEYKDVRKVREFVIAIDTSGSTSGELVQMFLRKTYNILMQRENFHTKINVRIIQCDARIQEDVKITSAAEFEQYMQTMKIRGLGGTDFRPVFAHVNDLVKDGELPHLKGLIYFTDGYGTFPTHQPAYKTAFVFLNDGYDHPKVPVWAIRLELEPEQIEELQV